MPQPTRFVLTVDFSDDEAASVSGRSTVRTAMLDALMSALKDTTDDLCDNLALIQRDDGELADAIVKLNSLSASVLALMGSGGFTVSNPLGWLTATTYAARTIVTNGTGTYVCAVAHTSGVFATDLAAGKWATLFDSVNYAAGSVSFTATGGISATNVQGAIAELDTEALKKASNLSDVAAVATARDNLSVPSKAALQLWSHTAAKAGGSADAITASFTPAITTLVGMDNLTVMVEAAAASTIAAATFTPNPGVVAAKTIKKLGLTDLQIGDIAGAGHRLILSYYESSDVWVLLNAANGGVITQAKGSDVVADTTIGLPTDGDMFDVTSGAGASVGALEARAAGVRVTLRFSVACTLVYSSNLLLQENTDHAVQSGDLMTFRSLGGGAWVEESRKNFRQRARAAYRLALAQLSR